MQTRSTNAGYRARCGRFLAQLAGVALLFGALLAGAQAVLAQDRLAGAGETALSLNGRVGQRFTLSCPAIREVQSSIWGTDLYTADSPVCQAALHAGVLSRGEAGTVTIEIGAGAKEYAGSTRNGVTSRTFGPYRSSYTFVAPEATLSMTPSGPPGSMHAGAGSPLGPTTTENYSYQAPPPATTASNNTSPPPAPPASTDTPPSGAPPANNNPLDPTGGKAVAKRMLTAVAKAVDIWKGQAQLTGQVHGIMLSVSPGGLHGPPLEPHIRNLLMAGGVMPTATEDKFAKVFGEVWQAWQIGFAIAERPAYPALGAWPGYHAPPTANIPFPLGAGVFPSILTQSYLSSMLRARFPTPTPQEEEAIEAFAKAAADNFSFWIGSTQVMNMMGSGPVPSYAPPMVGAGPVVGGTALMLPGGLVGPNFPDFGIVL